MSKQVQFGSEIDAQNGSKKMFKMGQKHVVKGQKRCSKWVKKDVQNVSKHVQFGSEIDVQNRSKKMFKMGQKHVQNGSKTFSTISIWLKKRNPKRLKKFQNL